MAAAFIPSNAKSVIDFGAGQMHVRKFLPESVKYYPVDYMSRCEETIVCNFNKDEFPSQEAEYAVVCGCLEWCEKPKEFFAKLAVKYDNIVLSYLPVEFSSCYNQQLERLGYYELLKLIYDHKMYVHKSSCLFFRSAVGVNDIILLIKRQDENYRDEDYFCGDLSDLSDEEWANIEKIKFRNHYQQDFLNFLSRRFSDMSIVEMKNFLIYFFSWFDKAAEIGRLLQSGEMLNDYQISNSTLNWLNSGQVVVYGAGMRGRTFLRILKEQGIRPKLVVDQTVRDLYIDHVHYEVHPPFVLTELRKLRIVITPDHFDEIVETVTKLGVCKKDYRLISEIVKSQLFSLSACRNEKAARK